MKPTIGYVQPYGRGNPARRSLRSPVRRRRRPGAV